LTNKYYYSPQLVAPSHLVSNWPLRCSFGEAKRFGTVQACSYSSSSEPTLKETFEKVLPAKRELLKKVKAHGDKKLGDVKVENALGGMRYASQNIAGSPI
jgi:hypothetical protein